MGRGILRTQHAATPYRATLWFVVGLLLLALYFQYSPLRFDPEPIKEAETETARNSTSDVLIVIDYNAIRRAGPEFRDSDFSVSWINLFEQELGPVSIATPEMLTLGALDEVNVIVLTHSVSGDIPTLLIDKVRQRVLEGALLITERPMGSIREHFGANGEAGIHAGGAITFVDGMEEDFARALMQMPLATNYIGSTAPNPRAQTLMAIDGAPVIYSVPVGKGHVVTVEFDLGQQLVSMQQGRPNPDFSVTPKHASDPITADLIMSPELQGSEVPYADMLERFIFWGIVQRYIPMPAFWLYPGGHDGAIIALHSGASLGAKSAWMLEYEAERNASSTVYIDDAVDMPAAEASTAHRRGGDLGFAYRMPNTPGELRETIGFGIFEPAERPVLIDSQIQTVRKAVDARLLSSLVAGHWWGKTWTGPLGVLAQVGIRVDSSYSDASTSGYAFGTGLPFLAVRRDGVPFGIREMPIVVPKNVNAGPSFLRLVELSNRGYHSAIPIDIDPAVFADYPDLDTFDAWLAMFDQAKENGHIVLNVRQFDNFLRARRAGGIRSIIQRNQQVEKRVEIEEFEAVRRKTPKSDSEIQVPETVSALRMRITAEPKARGMSLVVPEVVEGKRFYTARRRVSRVGNELVAGEVSSVPKFYVGYPVRLIPIDSGFNTIDVYYR